MEFESPTVEFIQMLDQFVEPKHRAPQTSVEPES